ncbi:esterase [Pseudomonas paraeruginosa]|uniref:serine hydrolase n=1 Tax=Pseudomonas paraeruginosa TaxID=2994495 RepID=UPI000D14D9E9|nr:serine hydrolase domain-containing protein [Pseudomonas paraeruginosa]AVR67900.1 esterase [Pseudomonas paraeruginosa]
MCGFEQGPGRSLAENVDQAIEAAVADQRLVGAVVLVAHRGQWPYRRAAGLADREAGRMMGEDSVGIRCEPRRTFEPSAYASGGAGMIDSAGDVLRLLEILRQGGAPLLTPGLVEEMGRDQVPGMELPANPGFGFGLGFSVLRDPAIAQSPESPGTWCWGGAYGHSWFVDRTRELSVVALTNTLFEGMSGRFVNDLRDAVYRSAEVR